MKNMENLEEMFISAKVAKIRTNHYIHEQEELYKKKAIDFLNKYNFNEIVEKACCKDKLFSISPIEVGPDKELTCAIRDLLRELGYTVKTTVNGDSYRVYVSWD